MNTLWTMGNECSPMTFESRVQARFAFCQVMEVAWVMAYSSRSNKPNARAPETLLHEAARR
jgi:hypothetical protein